MKYRTSITLFALMAAGLTAGAQEPTPTPPGPANENPAAPPAAASAETDASGAILAPKRKEYVPPQPRDSDGVTRTVSPGIAAGLAEGMPKYEPPTPTPTEEPEPKDMRDIDKPKNEIPRLPKYVVHEARPPVFRNQDIFTASGMIDLSFKSHPGLRLGNFFGLNSKYAQELYLDEQRTASIADLNDTAHAMALGRDAAEGRYILQATQDAYMHPSQEPVWGGPGGGGGFSGGGGK